MALQVGMGIKVIELHAPAQRLVITPSVIQQVVSMCSRHRLICRQTGLPMSSDT